MNLRKAPRFLKYNRFLKGLYNIFRRNFGNIKRNNFGYISDNAIITPPYSRSYKKYLYL